MNGKEDINVLAAVKQPMLGGAGNVGTAGREGALAHLDAIFSGMRNAAIGDFKRRQCI